MKLHYLLDSDCVSDLVRHPEGIIAKRVGTVGIASVATSIITVSELRYGIARRPLHRLSADVEAILSGLTIHPFASPADKHYATLRAELETRGTPIGANDMLIAAHALALDSILVTGNIREFSRVPGLTVENWIRPA